MKAPHTTFSRVSKLFADRDGESVDDALARRQRHVVTLRCGPDVEKSYALQLAVLTAANIANRCFPGAVRIALEPGLAEAPLMIWPSLNQTLGQALLCFLGPSALTDLSGHVQGGGSLVFGGAPPLKGSLRVTFDGWIAKVGPADSMARLPENDYCSLSGVLAAALAVSELFLSFGEISIEASRRTVGLSLWRPELDITDPEALGDPVEYLPREFWVLGLGHLGNAYLWSLATLPYKDPGEVKIFLNDFDVIEPENIETGLILSSDDIGDYKTRACAKWLEDRKFQTRLVERRFDSNFRCGEDEPRLAFCGFDSNRPRRDLANAQFNRVIESGLGGTIHNFDKISLHTLPNTREPEDTWPDATDEEKAKQRKYQESLAQGNPAYSYLPGDGCGHVELAGKSIAVPFIGATAASFVVAEIIRLLHGGPAYTNIKMSLADFGRLFTLKTGYYGPQDFAGLTFARCNSTETLRR